MMGDQISSSTARFEEYQEEDFQLTHGEAVLGVRYGYIPERVSYAIGFPDTRLIVIDGELRVLEDDAPPGLKPLSNDAALLRAGE